MGKRKKKSVFEGRKRFRINWKAFVDGKERTLKSGVHFENVESTRSSAHQAASRQGMRALTDYAKRDQRWCQGNLQHSYLLASQGFHPVSRVHFLSGILSYVASPIWLLWTLLAVAGWISQPGYGPMASATALPSQFTLFLVAGVFLFLPKVYGIIAVVVQGRSEQFGGVIRLCMSAMIETALSILLSPLMAVLHSQFVINTLSGRRVRWSAQNRCEQGVSATDAFADYRWHMLAGVLITISVFMTALPLLIWLSPILIGLVLAVPLAILLGDQKIGKRFLDWGLLVIPEEVRVPPVYERFQQALFLNSNQATVQEAPRFQQLIERADLFRLHEQVLSASEGVISLSESEKEEIKRFAIRGAGEIPIASRRAVLSDQELLNELHQASNHNRAVAV
jgi:membrane glycosyltransferase